MVLKIIHYADIQIEIRTSGGGSQRFYEFKDSLSKIEKEIEKEKPDIVVIPGDVFQFHKTNGEETKLFGKHLNKLKNLVKRIVLIPGNHDIRQKGIALYDTDKKRNLTDSIDSVVENIGSDKISYYDETGIYKDSYFDINWAVWSQRTKWNMDGENRPYSPWTENEMPDGNVIELFHDPRKGCIGFDRNPSKTFEDYTITLNSFKANTVLAGDIHAPEIVWFGENKEKLFTYSSSVVQRNYGEGDYYNNTELYTDGNNQHGFNIVEFDTEKNKAVTCVFKKIKPTVGRNTIKIYDDFNFEKDIENIVLENPSPINNIRIECNTSIKKFISNQEKITEYLEDNYNIGDINFIFSKNIMDLDETEVEDNVDIENIVSEEKLGKISKDYIDRIVTKTKTIDDEDKEKSKELIHNIFSDELKKIDLSNNRKDVKIHKLVISNFMNFSQNVEIYFDKMGKITRISGTNRIGKTTIFRAIKWIWTDQINKNQNSRNKKENYFAIFNDHTDLDEVDVSLDFSVNNEMHKLDKKLKRQWKKGKNIDKTNIKNLKSTPKIFYSLKTESEEIDNNDEVQSYLNNIINFNDLDRFVFINMDTLTDIIKMPSEDLGVLILDEIGLNFVNEMLDNYDNVKEDKLDKLSKPKEDIEVLLERIKNLNSEVESHESNLNDKNELLKKIKKALKKLDEKIETLRESLHKVDSIDILESDIEELEGKRNELKDKKSNLENWLSNKKNDVFSVEKLSNDKNNLKSELQEIEFEKSKNSDKINSLEDSISEKAKQANKLLEREKENQKNKIGAKEGEISKKEVEINNLKNQINDKLQNWKNSLNKEVDNKFNELEKLNGELDGLNSEKSEWSEKLNKLRSNKIKVENKIENCNEKLKGYDNNDNCPTCGKKLEEHEKEDIFQEKTELEKSLNKNNKLLKKITEKENSLSEKINGLENEISNLEDKTIKLNKEIKGLRNEINQENYPSELIELKKEKLKEVDGLNEKIQKIKENIEVINKDIIEYVKKGDEYLEISKKVKSFRKEINNLKDNIEVFDAEVENKKEQIEKCEEKIKKNNALKENIEKVDKKLNNVQNEIVVLDSKIKDKKSDIKLSKANIPTNEKINELKDKVSEIEAKKEDIFDEKMDIENKLYSLKETIKRNESDVEDAKEYKIFNSSMKLYKKLLGKKGLPTHIFSHIIPTINKKMNNLLEGVDFRLLFDKKTLTLNFYDIKNNIKRSVKYTSGMENTVIGLTLIHIIRKLNNKTKFDSIFIDEISGKLNSGKDLDYQAPNYQELVSDFIKEISNDMKVYIVDHVLDLGSFDVISVYPDENNCANVKEYHNLSNEDQ